MLRVLRCNPISKHNMNYRYVPNSSGAWLFLESQDAVENVKSDVIAESSGCIG